MNILGFKRPKDLLTALEKGDMNLIQDLYEEAEIIETELEEEFCRGCKETQCNYCPVYEILANYTD